MSNLLHIEPSRKDGESYFQYGANMYRTLYAPSKCYGCGQDKKPFTRKKSTYEVINRNNAVVFSKDFYQFPVLMCTNPKCSFYYKGNNYFEITEDEKENFLNHHLKDMAKTYKKF